MDGVTDGKNNKRRIIREQRATSGSQRARRSFSFLSFHLL
jgi:hypothetical protein